MDKKIRGQVTRMVPRGTPMAQVMSKFPFSVGMNSKTKVLPCSKNWGVFANPGTITVLMHPHPLSLTSTSNRTGFPAFTVKLFGTMSSWEER